MALVDYTPIKDDAFFDMLHTDVAAWFGEHQVDPDNVPMSSSIVLDTDTNEWVFTMWSRDESGALVTCGPPKFDPVARVERRSCKSLPPWAKPRETVG